MFDEKLLELLIWQAQHKMHVHVIECRRDIVCPELNNTTQQTEINLAICNSSHGENLSVRKSQKEK